MPGLQALTVNVSQEADEGLTQLIKAHQTGQQIVLRARIIQAAGQGHSNAEIARTPKHASWLNQVEIWLSILVRKLLKRGSFTSVEQLKAKVLAFVEYYNQTMAKPFKWTSKGKALSA